MTMEQLARDVMSGRDRSLSASLLRWGLWFAQWPYRCGVVAKNGAFDFGLRSPVDVGVPVISVGNLTTGGTGKTPIVAFLANWFRDAGVNVGLLSRGYRALNAADESTANDEKLVLDQLCPGVPHWLNADRVDSARRAVGEAKCELLILDDGFQHRRLHRDLDIVLIDALNPWGYGYCLPRGLLREPVHAIQRAGMAFITRADAVSADDLTAIRTELVKHDHVGTVVEVSFRPTVLINSEGETRPLSEIADRRCFGFCGVGNPNSFEQTLRSLGADVVAFQTFPDHHHFTSDDCRQLAERVAATSADMLLVTQKDLVKLRLAEIGGWPLWAVSIGVEILRGSQILDQMLWSILERVRSASRPLP